MKSNKKQDKTPDINLIKELTLEDLASITGGGARGAAELTLDDLEIVPNSGEDPKNKHEN